jgi:ABC-type antimicrobial peptide transport system permease subunit
MQRTEHRTTWHRPALVVSFAVFLILTFTSSPSVSSIPTLSDLEMPALPTTLVPKPVAASPAPSSGHEAQRLYLETLPYGSAIVDVSARTGVDGLLIASVIAFPVAWWAMHKWLESFAYQVNINFGLFALSALVAVGIALFTISYQAIRSANSNPAEVLKRE